MMIPAGARLRAAVAEERPLQVVGAINAYSALLAQRALNGLDGRAVRPVFVYDSRRRSREATTETE